MDTDIHNLQRNDQKDVQRWVPIASKKKQKQPNLSRPENTPMSIAAPGSRTFDLSRSHLYCHLDRTLLAGSLWVLCTLASNTVNYFLSLFSARASEPLSTYHFFLSNSSNIYMLPPTATLPPAIMGDTVMEHSKGPE